MIRAIGKAIKKAALGEAAVSQQCTVGMPDPQLEIRVWLQALGTQLDVTDNHVIACASPFTVGIGVNEAPYWRRAPRSRTSLMFCERNGEQRLLAEIGLETCGSISDRGQELCLFQIRSCRNYCLPRYRIWAHDLHQLFVRRRNDKNPEIRMSVRSTRSMNVFFICPRPVVLVSAMHENSGNIFPMNLFGSVANGYFAFSLNSLRNAAPLVERAGRVALSSIPLECAGLARQLGRNHRLDSANWDELPFRTRASPALRLPIPEFALRVREMEIEAVRKLGSHTLFIARLIRDERLGKSLQFCMIHGIYQAWRLNNFREQLQQ